MKVFQENGFSVGGNESAESWIDMISGGRKQKRFAVQQNVFVSEVPLEQRDICSIICRTCSLPKASRENHWKNDGLHCLYVCKFRTCNGITGLKRLACLRAYLVLYPGLNSRSILMYPNLCVCCFSGHRYTNTNKVGTKQLFLSKRFIPDWEAMQKEPGT